MKKLNKIGSKNQGIMDLSNGYDDIIRYIENGIFIHYIFFGAYTAGKSFTLNNIIGYNYNLLYCGNGETTRHAFIIRRSNSIKLYRVKLIKSKYGYVFNKTKQLAIGKNEVKKKIEDLNKIGEQLSFFILETPIQLFENSSIPENLLNSIEMIDYPGLNTERAQKGNYANNSIFIHNFINGIFFVNKLTDYKMNSAQEIFDTFFNKFIFKDTDMEDIRNCLFLYTKNSYNEQSDFFDLDIKSHILGSIEDLENENMNSMILKKLKIKSMNHRLNLQN